MDYREFGSESVIGVSGVGGGHWAPQGRRSRRFVAVDALVAIRGDLGCKRTPERLPVIGGQRAHRSSPDGVRPSHGWRDRRVTPRRVDGGVTRRSREP